MKKIYNMHSSAAIHLFCRCIFRAFIINTVGEGIFLASLFFQVFIILWPIQCPARSRRQLSLLLFCLLL